MDTRIQEVILAIILAVILVLVSVAGLLNVLRIHNHEERIEQLELKMEAVQREKEKREHPYYEYRSGDIKHIA